MKDNLSSSNEQSLFMYDEINNELVEVGSLKGAEKYTRENFTEGNTAHPDYWGYDLFVKVGQVDENCKASLLNKEQGVQECDAREAPSSAEAGNQNPLPEFVYVLGNEMDGFGLWEFTVDGRKFIDFLKKISTSSLIENKTNFLPDVHELDESELIGMVDKYVEFRAANVSEEIKQLMSDFAKNTISKMYSTALASKVGDGLRMNIIDALFEFVNRNNREVIKRGEFLEVAKLIEQNIINK